VTPQNKEKYNRKCEFCASAADVASKLVYILICNGNGNGNCMNSL
jgi:hypothetical protein